MFSTVELNFDRFSSRIGSPRPSTSEGMRGGPSTPRSSLDHSRQLSEASSSRRPSTSSIHQSPTSTSSSHRQQAGHEKGENAHVGYGEVHGLQASRIPRITTSYADLRKGEDRDHDGPQSAPAQGPLRPLLDGHGSIVRPSRSASSPEPGTPQNSKNTPIHSPSENRINATAGPSGPPILGLPYIVPAAGWSKASQPPPRTAATHISSHGDLHDRAVNSRPSHSSLSGSTAGTTTPELVSDAPAIVGDSLATPRTVRRGDSTYCGHCGQLVHGQFVRAMGKVFHLNCFRCQVRSSPVPDVPLTIHLGLRQSCGAEVFSCRGYNRDLPSLREGLLCPARLDLCQM